MKTHAERIAELEYKTGMYRLTHANEWDEHCAGSLTLKGRVETAKWAASYIRQLEARLVETNKTSDDLRAKLAEYDKPLVPMTLEKVFAVSRDEGNIVWLEYRDEKAVRCGYNGYYEPQHIMAYTAFGGYKGEVTFYPPGAETEKTPDPAVYGIGWRCWPRKPTDEEREAAKWDE